MITIQNFSQSGYIESASKRDVGAACSREFKCRDGKHLALKYLNLVILNFENSNF
jgi:hypothetical protein